MYFVTRNESDNNSGKTGRRRCGIVSVPRPTYLRVPTRLFEVNNDSGQ